MFFSDKSEGCPSKNSIDAIRMKYDIRTVHGKGEKLIFLKDHLVVFKRALNYINPRYLL